MSSKLLLRERSRWALVLVGLLVLAPLSGCVIERAEESAEASESEAAESEARDTNEDAAEDDDRTEYDIDWADVDVGLQETTVNVPKVDVYTEKEQVVVPYIDIDWNADDDESVERELAVDVELTEPGHEVYIDEIYGSGDELIVVARLRRDAGEEDRRASDRMVVSGPETDIEYYLVADDPGLIEDAGEVTVVRSVTEIPADLDSARRIYGHS